MRKDDVVIGNLEKTYANPIAELINQACHYHCNLFAETGDKKINLKSIMGVMAVGLKEGMELTITADGKDEDEAIDAIEEFFVCE